MRGMSPPEHSLLNRRVVMFQISQEGPITSLAGKLSLLVLYIVKCRRRLKNTGIVVTYLLYLSEYFVIR